MENYSTETQLRFQLPVKHFFKLNDDYCGLFILQYMFFFNYYYFVSVAEPETLWFHCNNRLTQCQLTNLVYLSLL